MEKYRTEEDPPITERGREDRIHKPMGVVANNHESAAGNAAETSHTMMPTRQPDHHDLATWQAWEPVIRACAGITPVLEKTISRFWNLPIQLKFFAASRRQLYFWQADEFYVSQLMLNAPSVSESMRHQYIAQLRLSDQACGALLNEALGPAPAVNKQTATAFQFNRMTRFEAQLMQEFSRELFQSLAANLVRKKLSASGEADIIHLAWLIQPEIAHASVGQNEKPLFFKEPLGIGKMILSVPRQALQLSRYEARETEPVTLPDDLFLHACAEVRVYLGSTRVPLLDLQQLEPGDLVVLENSSIEYMALVDPVEGELLPVEVELTDRNRLEVPDVREVEMLVEQQEVQRMSAKQNLWDNLLIEVNAEFESLKLPLHQLKQMSEGVVVELGDLTRNTIALQVEGKVLAQGELVVVGDKFGVRVTRVEGSEEALGQGSDSARAIESRSSATPQASETPKPSEGGEADDFLDEFDEDFDEGEW